MFGLEIAIFWKWLIAGGIMLVLELVMPGVFLLWLGIAAAITSVIAFIFPAQVELQALVFAVVSVINVFIAYKYLKIYSKAEASSVLNRRGESYIGKRYEYNDGKIKVGDTYWKAEGNNLRNGTMVEVFDVDSTVLKVKNVD